MSEYKIKTDKFNIFTGTRAEAIVDDLGSNKRVVCGAIPFVLPAVATLRDLDIVNPANKDAPIEVILDSLQPAAALQQYFTPDEFFYGVLNAFYGVTIEDKPKTTDPTILVVDMIDGMEKIQKGFKAKERLANNIADLLNQYSKADIVFVYSGAAESAPEKRLFPCLRKFARQTRTHLMNSKVHNPFFDSYLEEMVEDLGNKEVVVVGAELQDKVFYTAVNALDVAYKPNITVLPQYVLGVQEFGKPITQKSSALELIN